MTATPLQIAAGLLDAKADNFCFMRNSLHYSHIFSLSPKKFSFFLDIAYKTLYLDLSIIPYKNEFVKDAFCILVI